MSYSCIKLEKQTYPLFHQPRISLLQVSANYNKGKLAYFKFNYLICFPSS